MRPPSLARKILQGGRHEGGAGLTTAPRLVAGLAGVDNAVAFEKAGRGRMRARWPWAAPRFGLLRLEASNECFADICPVIPYSNVAKQSTQRAILVPSRP